MNTDYIPVIVNMVGGVAIGWWLARLRGENRRLKGRLEALEEGRDDPRGVAVHEGGPAGPLTWEQYNR